MRIAIADDKREDGERIRDLMQARLPSAAFDLFDSGEALLKTLQPGQYDLLLLDIYMQGITGIETARRMREVDKKAKLVFITTSNDFAAESYALHADHYLLKPVDEASVDQLLERVHLTERDGDAVLSLPGGIQCPRQSIMYTEYSNHRITLHLENGQARKVWMAQAELEQRLGGADFVTCTKGIIIGLRWVDRLEGATVLMKDGRQIPISRGRKAEVKQAHADYLFRLMLRGDTAN